MKKIMQKTLDLSLTATQKQFIDAKADEVLFGGAAGGGKSYGQLVDALLYALRYPKAGSLFCAAPSRSWSIRSFIPLCSFFLPMPQHTEAAATAGNF